MILSAIKAMEAYSSTISDITSLSQGIPFMNSDEIARSGAVRALFTDRVDKYSPPQGIEILRKEIANNLIGKNMHYTSNEIIVTGGAMEALSATMLALLHQGDEIIIPTPTYTSFFKIVSLTGATVKQIPLEEDRGWKMNVEKVEQSITKKTKAILLCNPNNPTGTIYTKGELEEIYELAERYNLYIILDEVYEYIHFYHTQPYSLAMNEKYKDRIIRIVSFSKTYAMTGWRVGYLHTNQQLAETILPVHDSIMNCAPVISQYAALYALKNHHRIISDHLEIYKTHRQLMGTMLERLRQYITFKWPEGTYYFFPKVIGVKNSQELCIDIVKKVHLAVVPGDAFGNGGEGHIRLCCGRSKEDIVNGMQKLVTYFSQYYEQKN